MSEKVNDYRQILSLTNNEAYVLEVGGSRPYPYPSLAKKFCIPSLRITADRRVHRIHSRNSVRNCGLIQKWA